MIKYIGQHIVDFIARFRSDVYLEDIADGTVVDNKFLGLDSNNKIVKEAASATVTDLHSAGVDGSANQLLTDDGDGTITSESTLTYNSEILSIGADDDGVAEIIRTPHSDGAGGELRIKGGSATAGQTDQAGSKLRLFGGQGTGTGVGGHVEIKTAPAAGSTGTTLNALSHTWEFADDGSTTIPGNLALSGDTITSAADLNIVATGNDINVDTDNFTIESALAHSPYFVLKSTENGADGAHFQFVKDRGAAAVNDDNIGSIDFTGENDAQEVTTYGTIVVSALEVDDTDEAGRMTFKVAESDGTTSHRTAGLVIEGSDNATDGEVNVTIGAGAASTTTIAGGFSAQGTLTYDSETLTVGAADAGDVSIQRTAISSGNGGNLKVNGAAASGADRIGGVVYLEGGQGTGAANGGSVYIQGAPPGSSGSSLNSLSFTNRFDFKVGQASPYGTTPPVGRGWQQIIDISTSGEDFEDVYIAGDGIPGHKLKYAPAGIQSSLGVGEIYYLHTDGSWIQADASATSTGATQLLAVIGAGGALPAKGCFIEGMIRIPAASILNTPGSGAVDGLPVYVSTTAGHFDFTAPSGNDEYVRCVGYALDDDTGATGDVLVWFKPDNTFVKITA